MDGGAIVAIVYAKSQSERVPGKNTRLLGGVPLFWHITATANRTSCVDLVVVDTDCPQVALHARQRGVRCVARPAHLASNEATGDDLVVHSAAMFPGAAVLLQLYPTSPFVSCGALTAAVLACRDHNSATGITSSKDYLWRGGRPATKVVPSQFLEPTVRETTGFYATRRDYVVSHRRRVDPSSCFGVELPPIEAIDINYEDDWKFAEVVWNGLHWKGVCVSCPEREPVRCCNEL